MAIAVRGTFSNNAADGDLTLTLPGGIAQNDVVVVNHQEGASSDLTMSMTTTGYTTVADLYANDTLDTNMGVHWKRMGATPDSTAVTNDSGGTVPAAIGYAFSGVDTTTALDATTTTVTGIDGPIPDPPSIATVTANAWVVALGGSTEMDTPTAPTNYSNLVTHTAGSRNPMGATREIASPTTEDPGTFGGIAGQGSDSWAAATVALRPGAGGVDTSESRSGTVAGTATGTGRQASQNEKRSAVSATATVTGRQASQDAKRSDVTGAATVTGVSTFANATWEKAGTSSGAATVTGRVAVQDAKRSTVTAAATVTGTLIQEAALSRSGTSSGAATVTGRIAVEDRKRSDVSGSATVTGVATSESAGTEVSVFGTSSAQATVEARIAWMAEIMGNSSGSATVNGVSDSEDLSGGVTTTEFFNPMIASVGKMMIR